MDVMGGGPGHVTCSLGLVFIIITNKKLEHFRGQFPGCESNHSP